MGGPDMATLDELIAYVVLLSLPLWLLIEQLLFIRMTRRPKPDAKPDAEPERERRAPAAFRGALRPGQR